jgi:HSP20 family protein
MDDLTRWKNEQFKNMKVEMEQLLRNFIRDFGAPVFARLEGEGPLLEIVEDEEKIYIRLELPDLEPGDLEIAVSRETLLIKARKREKTIRGGRPVERQRGFSNRLKLPCPVVPDEVEAVLQDHHLEIRLPKCRGEVFKAIRIRRLDR